MIVSHNWLAEYVDLPMPLDELTERLTLTGLNLEGVEQQASPKDVAIDLEVTSNRPDCLGHIGVAREVAVVWGLEHRIPKPQPATKGKPVADVTSVSVDCPDLCPRYNARVIRGVKIGPSPAWLQERLRSIGVAVVNNVVDITNFVLFECGQPLHAFDFAKLEGGEIRVRKATAGEEFTAIDHKTYTLTGDEVVIADARRPVALGGVMGGYDTEVSEETTDLLIESADFAPLAVRGAARRHQLHSPSSYRFERGVDPEGLDWASRRCCELILELAGGELCEGMIDIRTKQHAAPREAVSLRFAQIPRLLGVEIADDEATKILTDLGCQLVKKDNQSVTVTPPTWRADLTREADLLEEVARIHGYDEIPEDVGVRMAPSSRSREERVVDQTRQVLSAAGFDEAVTLSAVEPTEIEAFQPWTTAPPIATGTAVLRRANCLRQSLAPSLLECRRTNETLSNPTIELYEIAKVYLPREGKLPEEKRVLTLTSGGGFLEVKGVIESLVEQVAPGTELLFDDCQLELFEPAKASELTLGAQRFGFLGEVSAAGLDRFGLRNSTTIAEVDLAPLVEAARLVRTAAPLSSYPPVERDLNIVVAESTRWAEIERIARDAAGEWLESVAFGDDTFRDASQLGEGKKSVLFSLQLRKADGTLTGEQADAAVASVVEAIEKQLDGRLRA